MNWLWTWGGECFGYREGDDLWTHDSRHVGRFIGDTIYDCNGRYLGEIMSENRLIRRQGAQFQQGYSFTPWARRPPYVKYVNYVGYVMYASYEDFPAPSEL
ncbi:4-fold beta flower protein [Rhizobium leguminosarum]